MFLFGDIAKTAQLLHSSDIGELMAEPPVLARACRQARDAAGIARLVPSPEPSLEDAAPVAATPAAAAPPAAHNELPGDGERAAA